ncbi:MAG: hypothetical protein KDA64_08950 [Rhodospirillaceae bacterium]|nr:hypothetical protein [Rhodospirillaceae bacterium]
MSRRLANLQQQLADIAPSSDISWCFAMASAFGHMHPPADAGLPSPSALLRQRRDGLLRQMRERHFPALSDTAAARQIHRVLDRYARTGWRRHADFPRVPEEVAGTPEAFAWEILSLGVEVPRELRKILGPGYFT